MTQREDQADQTAGAGIGPSGDGTSGAGGGYGSLMQVRTLLSGDEMLLAGWTHFLAFDLVVGALIAERMDRAGIGRLLQAPLLASIFMFGPLGMLLALLTELAARPAAGRVEA